MNNSITDTKNYLFQFDQILNDMANKMFSNKITNNITTDFITCMIPHHQAAIFLCQNLLNYTNNKALKEIAQNIIRVQTRGIQEMRQILSSGTGFKNSIMDSNIYINNYFNITNTMIMKMVSSVRSGNINLNFTEEMIPHHQGAIDMCNNLLNYYIDPNLYKLASNIIREQSIGIRKLREIQNTILDNNLNK